jgi:hypothetical protein
MSGTPSSLLVACDDTRTYGGVYGSFGLLQFTDTTSSGAGGPVNVIDVLPLRMVSLVVGEIHTQRSDGLGTGLKCQSCCSEGSAGGGLLVCCKVMQQVWWCHSCSNTSTAVGLQLRLLRHQCVSLDSGVTSVMCH